MNKSADIVFVAFVSYHCIMSCGSHLGVLQQPY